MSSPPKYPASDLATTHASSPSSSSGGRKAKEPSSEAVASSSHSSSSSNNNNEGGGHHPPLPFVSTPARDKLPQRLQQQLQLSSSSNNNNNPAVASPGPHRVFAAGSPMRTFSPVPHYKRGGIPGSTPGRQYDLTPVMRNTNPTSLATSASAAGGVMVSPEDCDDLHGEHLALPEDLVCKKTFSARPVHPGPVLPPLTHPNLIPSSSGLFGDDEDDGVVVLSSSASSQQWNSVFGPPPTSELFLDEEMASGEAHLLLQDSIPFPPSGKSYTFTSRRQYERHCSGVAEEEEEGEDELQNKTKALKPYQPTRQDWDHGVHPEQVQSILMTRSRSTAEDDDDGNLTDKEEKHDDSTLLTRTIPLSHQDWSIPSLRMAHQLMGGSIASLSTTYTDDEESTLVREGDDNASLSSLGSYCSWRGGGGGGEDTETGLPVMVEMPPSRDDDNDIPTTTTDNTNNVHNKKANKYHRRRRRHQQQEQRDRNALEWLRTVQADQDAVAEAASSKFLTQSSSTGAPSLTLSYNNNMGGDRRRPSVCVFEGLVQDQQRQQQQRQLQLQQKQHDQDHQFPSPVRVSDASSSSSVSSSCSLN